MKKLPIGIQTFSKIIEDDLAYVDKTKVALELIKNGSYYFLSRPRRFGKSLFVDTLKEMFEGNASLFKGLYIEDKWDWADTYPVVKLSFGSGVTGTIEELHRTMHRILGYAQEDLGVDCPENSTPEQCFHTLIREAHKKFGKKVVILIDEYDKPILDNITKKEQASMIRDEMKNFYSVIKDNDAHVEFVFITGVSKFSKMSLFSGLNNLNDITLDERFATICGYTHHDLETVFKEHLVGVDLDKVRQWYNGYNYFGDKVYNPFDILLFIDKGYEFKNYWWSTGNPSFLIDILEQREYFIPRLENFEASEELLDSFDVNSIELEALLWQTGYLTIKEKIQEFFGMIYILEVPNREIQTSLNNLFITHLTTHKSQKLRQQSELFKALQNGDLPAFEQILKSLFASIPYQNFINNQIAEYEGYYASVIYAYLASLGFDTIAEDSTNKGRIDMTLLLPDKVYIFEFKVVDSPSGDAMQQIKSRKYYEKYQGKNPIYLIGVEFSKAERNIVTFEWEQQA